MATLTEDIQAIRKFKKISLNDLYDKTKVPAHIIDMIDNGSIFSENPTNKTYIRSFVRTYSKGLGISEADIIQALDDHELDVYDGFLADKYMSNMADEPSGPVQKTDSHGTDKKAADERPGRARKETQKSSGSGAVSSKKGKSVSNKSEDTERDLDEEDEKLRQTKSTHTSGSQSVDLRPDYTKAYNSRTPQPADLDSINWSDTVKRFNPLEKKFNAFAIFGSLIGVIFIVVAGYYIYNSDSLTGFLGNGTTADLDEAVQLPITVDSTSVQTEAEPVAASLPDTLELVIFAANDKLEPVRIRSDINNVLSPYWIEQGQIHRTDFIDEVLIRGQYSRMVLVYNGHEIEDIVNLTTQDQFVRISRDFLDADSRYKTPGSFTFPEEEEDEDIQSDTSEVAAD
ncbi:MAG: helix-turn-helix domain-containing protein [Balneolales bacterium]